MSKKTFEECWKIIENDHPRIQIEELIKMDSGVVEQPVQKQNVQQTKQTVKETSNITIDYDIETFQNELKGCKTVVEYVNRMFLLVYRKSVHYQDTGIEHQYMVKVDDEIIKGSICPESQKLAKRKCAEALFHYILGKFPHLRPLQIKFDTLIK